MPRREITDIEEIEGIINRAVVCHLGLMDEKEPYVIPINFGYERNVLYFHGNLKGRKVDLIKKNNLVCFGMEVDLELKKAEQPCDWAMKYKSVIGVGKASILQNDEQKVHALNLITERYAGIVPSFPNEKLEKTLVVKIDIESMTGKQLV